MFIPLPRKSSSSFFSRRLWPLGRLAVIAAGLILAGCAATKKPKPIELVWPEPPEIGRIKFVQTLASERDLREPTVGENLLSVLIGRKPPVSHLYEPTSIAVSDDGSRVYVSDYGQNLIYVFDLKEKKLRFIGQEHPVGRPFGIALDRQENIYVTDQVGKMVRVFDKTGNPLKSFGGQKVGRPTGIAIDRQRGRIYVADSASKKERERNFVKVFDMAGSFLGNLGEGKEGEGYQYFPTYLAVDREGNLYVADTLNSQLFVFDAEGNYLRKFGQKGDSPGSFDKPKGVALDGFGNVYVVDSSWSNVQVFNQRGDALLFFGGRSRYPGLMENPTGIAIDGRNRIYVADTFNFRVNVYQLINTTAKDTTSGGNAGK